MGKLSRFMYYYRPHGHLIIADLVFAFISSAAALAYPLLISVITKHALGAEKTQALEIIRYVIIAFVVLMVVDFVATFFINYVGHVTGARIEYDMRKDLYEHYQKLSFSFYDNQKVGQLMSRITNDLNQITELSHHGPEDVTISLVRIVGSFIILSHINMTLTLIIFSILPLMAAYSYFFNRKMAAAFRENQVSIANINMQVEDTLAGIRVVKSFASEQGEMENFHVANESFVHSKKHAFFIMASFIGGVNVFIAVINAVTAVGGAFLIFNGYMEIEDLITFLLYINLLIAPVQQLVRFTEQYQSGMAGFGRFLEILDTTPEIQDDPNAVEIPNVKGKIEFSNVDFRYSEETEAILSNLNLVANPGDYIALVGSSGVGKTTLCNLIPRFYDVIDGTIFIDGYDIRKVTQKTLRQNIGIVQQDVYLFASSIYDNIAYGKKDATKDEIIIAAKNANVHDFITKLPDGYNTLIGQRGIKLSGGQRQRLSIARAFLKNPPILIFDEATSSLDNESEQIVQESFSKLSKNRTTFVIAHRLSTIKNAQRILVLTEDGIVEDGNHQQLMELKGIYSKLFNMQFI